MNAWISKWRDKLDRQRLRRIATGVIGGVTAYALLGFVVLPMVVKIQLQKQLQAQLGRPVSVYRVMANPFVLSVEIDGLRVGRRDGGPAVAGFDRAYANLQLESIWRGGVVLRELSLEGPRLVVIRHKDGTLNWSDLLKPADAAPPPAKTKGGIFPFALNNIRISGGNFTFIDEEKDELHALNGMELGIPFLSSLKNGVDTEVTPVFKGRLDGAPVVLEGRTRFLGDHKDADLDIRLDGLDLARYARWLPLGGGYRLVRGRAGADVKLSFQNAPDGSQALKIGGDARLADFALANADGRDAVAFKALELGLGELQPLAGSYHLASVHLVEPHLALRRMVDGKIDLAGVAPASGEKSDSAPPRLALDRLGLEGGVVDFVDDAVAGAQPVHLSGVSLQVEHFAWPGSEPSAVKLALSGPDGLRLEQSGKVVPAPFAADGSLQLEGLSLARIEPYLAQQFPALRLQGKLGLQGEYALKSGDAGLAYAWKQGQASLSAFSLGRQGQAQPDLSLAGLQLAGLEVDGSAQRIGIDSVVLKDPQVRVERAKDGSLALQEAFAASGAGRDRLSLETPEAGQASPAVRSGKASKAASPPAAVEPARKPWTADVAKLNVSGGGVEYRDASLPGGVELSLSGIDAALQGFSTRPGTQAKLDLKAKVDKRGELALKGQVGSAPVDADLAFNLERIPLTPLKGVLGSQLRLSLDSGATDGSGRLKFALDDKGRAKGSVTGALAVHDLKLSDPRDHSELLRWRELAAKGIDFRLEPMSGRIEDVQLSDFFSRLQLDEKGHLNVTELVPAKEEAKAPAAGAKAEAELAPPRRDLPPFVLGKLTMRGGAVDFSDHFIRPNYQLHMVGIEGDLQNLTTASDSLAKLNLKARAASTARVTVSGEFNPFRADRYLEVRAAVRGFELPALSSYSGRYVGYGIASGVFSADLKYKIENLNLTATNQVFLDQLELGDAVDSPDAVTLPLALAIALLRDSSGRIHLNLPVAGSLDNPEFSIGGVLGQAVVNLFAKALTSPFTLLASALGGSSEELSRIGFDPGYAELDEAAVDRLRLLGKGLKERPSLTLTMTPKVDAQEDRHALKWAWIWGKLHKERLSRTGKDEGDITGEEYPVLLRRVYVDTDMEKPRNFLGFAKDATVPEMEQRLLAHLKVSDDELLALGQKRAQAAKVWLVEQAAVAPERIRIQPTEVKPPVQEGEAGPAEDTFTTSRLDFSLS